METTGLFRAVTYDSSDTDYATTLKRIFISCHSPETQEKFNEISQNLMDDKQINHRGLLNAIDAYEASEYNLTHPLHMSFTERLDHIETHPTQNRAVWVMDAILSNK